MDEFHFYADPERGWAWQVPLLELTRTQFVLMSATLGDVTTLAERPRTSGRDREVAHVTSTERPVPLSYSYVTTPVHETLEELLTTHQAPVYVVHFTQAAAIEQAQALMSINVCSREEKDAIAELIGEFRFTAGFGQARCRGWCATASACTTPGMLPKYRRLVELLAQSGLLKVVCGTDTLGVGHQRPDPHGAVHRPDQVRRGADAAPQGARVSSDRRTCRTGRVRRRRHGGRPGAGARRRERPPHQAKAGDDPKKLKRVERKKAPEGFVSWGQPTFERLDAAPNRRPSTRRSGSRTRCCCRSCSGRATSSPTCGCCCWSNDEPRVRQRALVRQAIRIFRALEQAGTDRAAWRRPDATGRTVRLTVELQRNFALDQPLSPFAVAALELLDVASPSYTLDLVSMVEATLERAASGARKRNARRPRVRRSPR